MNDNEVYRLAILAAQLNPELCKTKPTEAIREARRLLAAVRMECRSLQDKLAQEEGDKWMASPITYSEAVREITGENKKKNPHLSYAKARFVKFWAFWKGITVVEAKRELREYENGKKSFDNADAYHLPGKYELWKSQPKKAKGKQGRRISKYDGRVGIRSRRGASLRQVSELRRG
jgi:hypothetical protein